jgi:hypothetical protein
MSKTPAQIMDIQFRFAKRLQERGVTIYFQGSMYVPDRWKVIRATIIDYGLTDTPFRTPENGKRDDAKAETFSQAYERATGEPLIPAEQEDAA